MVKFNIFRGIRRARSFRVKKKVPLEDGQLDTSRLHAGTLCSSELYKSIGLPEGENRLEWLAINTVSFYYCLDYLYGSITEFCTPLTCSVMSAGSRYQYYWYDMHGDSKRKRFSAPQYIDSAMSLIQSLVEDSSIFPRKLQNPFPANFLEIIKMISKQLHRVYAHIYFSHLKDFELIEGVPHLNTSFAYFSLFAKHFSLIAKKELEPLNNVTDYLLEGSKTYFSPWEMDESQL